MGVKERDLRAAIVGQCQAMDAAGLSPGSAGNISARFGDAMLITPSAVPYERLRPELLTTMPINGEYGAWSGPLKPSTEWRFHLDIMRARPDVGAIVHCHSNYATALAICGREIPAVHYMIAGAGGPTVRVAPYATYGTKALSDNALAALEGRNCCLLSNHGQISTGPTLDKAMWLAVELETLAKQYVIALTVGGARILPDDEIALVVEKFKDYGPKPKEEKHAAE